MKIKLILSLTLFLSLFSSIAQSDVEFWFAAPEVTSEHGDAPVFLRISTLNSPARISLTQPSNPAFGTINYDIPASSSRSIELTARLRHIENFPADRILNKGIYISSTAEVSIYYEVMGYSSFNGYVNTDIYTLKGGNALGTFFVTPFQNFWPNENSNLRNAYSSFIIVATEDNTKIYIKPGADLVGHVKGEFYSITLNKGQTYTGMAKGKEPEDRPSGTEIYSDKPIAVTVSDDSVLEKASYDLIGDQLVPVKHLGTEYIFLRTGPSEVEKGFLCATENNTEIYIGNSQSPAILNLGETLQVDISGPSTYIRSSKPVYAFHIAAIGDELGGALLPEIGCTGSRQITFTRSTEETFALGIIVKAGAESAFKLAGSDQLLTSSDFTIVPGTNGRFLSCKKIFDDHIIQPGKAYIIENSVNDFHLATFNGDTSGTSFRYGYFSSYGKLDLPPLKKMCPGEAITLNAGTEKDSYLWSTGATSQTITTSLPGKYWVKVSKGTCEFSDTTMVSWNDVPHIDLGPDKIICSDESVKFEVQEGYASYEWSTGETSNIIIPEKAGTYTLTVKNEDGCLDSDTITLTIHNNPIPEIFFDKSDESLCKDSLIRVYTSDTFSTYLWNNGDTSPSAYMPPAMTYTVEVTDINNCKGKAERVLDCSPFIKVFNLITPNGDNQNDYFVLEGLHGGQYILEVYNRWGEKVYHNSAYDNNWQADNLPDGIYYYHLTHQKGKKEFKGWVQVLRTNP